MRGNMWIRKDVSGDNPNRWQIEAGLELDHVHLDDTKSYLIENGGVKELPLQMEMINAPLD